LKPTAIHNYGISCWLLVISDNKQQTTNNNSVMTEPVLPLQTILLQVLFLLVAIALEARVLQRRLSLTRRTSVEYATSINLLCAVMGWLGFFLLKNLLPQPLKTQLISYIFFDRLMEPLPEGLSLVIVSTGIIMFFSAFLIKLKGLQLLEALLQRSPEHQSSLPPEKRRRRGLQDRLDQAIIKTDPRQATTVLLANAYSHSAILLLLLLRFFSLRINTFS
jgi:hypothetical protein